MSLIPSLTDIFGGQPEQQQNTDTQQATLDAAQDVHIPVDADVSTESRYGTYGMDGKQTQHEDTHSVGVHADAAASVSTVAHAVMETESAADG